MSDSENDRIESPPLIDDNAELDSADDLFGDGGDDDNDNQDDGHQSETLSEHSLGPEDEERFGYDEDDGADNGEVKEELVMDVDLFRHRVPKPSDGMLHSLRVPSFIRIQPEEYHADSYEPTIAELEDSLAQHPKSTARYRRDPSSGALQSNAAIYHWDDGSVTIAIGDEHFEVLTKSLAPAGAAGEKVTASKPYQELQDAHYYAAAAHLSSSLLLTVAHVGEQYTVRANRTVADDALQRLTDRLHAATKTSAGAGANMIIRTMRDPELAKKEAELAEKERERARRRRENASARLEGGYGAGGRSGRAGGALSISDLEGGAGGRRSGIGAGRKRGAGGVPRPKRRRPEYDSDDELPHGARRNDDYDKEDDFIAPSDDEMSEGGADDDDDEEELEDDDDEDEDDRHASRRTKRQRTAEAEDEEDAEADPDEDVPARTSGGGGADAARRARRHIIEDDDEDEE